MCMESKYICESFINILFLDDEILTDEISQKVIENMGILNFPVNIYGIDDIKKEDIRNKISCFLYDRDHKNFNINKTVALEITDFQIIFIDYKLKGETTGSDIKDYLYEVDLSARPKLVLLSRYSPGSNEINKAAGHEITQSRDVKFDDYLNKGDNMCRIRNIIFQEAKKRYDIVEYITLSPSAEFKPGANQEEKEIHFTDVFRLETKILSRLWISNKTSQVAFIYHEEGGEELFSEKDFNYFKNYGEGKQTLNTNIYNNCLHDMIQASFILKFNLGSYIDKYMANLGRNEIDMNQSYCMFDCLTHSSLNFPEEVKKLNDSLLDEKSVVVQLFSITEKGHNYNITLPILIKRPDIHFPNLYYSKQIIELIEILSDGKYNNFIKSAKQNEQREISRTISETHEYYKIEISIGKDKIGYLTKIIGDIFQFLQSVIKAELKPSISIFDLIGPSMIGPSSSHTCGANRIGRVARRIIEHYLKEQDLTSKTIILSARLHDSFRKTGKGHKTLNAFAAGLLEDIKKDDINVAICKFDAWQESENDNKLIDGTPTVKVKWLGYNNFETLPDEKYDIPLPPNYPKSDDPKKRGAYDIHENAVAILVKLVNKDKENISTLNFDANWNYLDLVIVGESIGGGKIQIKAIGGSLINEKDILLKHWEYVKDDKNSFFVFKEKSKSGDVVLPLNGNNSHIYTGIANIEDYPPKIELFLTNRDKLTYAGLDDLIKEIKEENEKVDPQNKKTLLQFAIEYEYWHLTGANVAIREDTNCTKDYNQKLFKIISEADDMLKALIDSQEDFSETTIPDRKEKEHLINTYRKVKENIRDYMDAAVHGAITAMTKNALSIDKILAAPTGGACGVIPGTYAGLIMYFKGRDEKRTEEEYREALFISGFLAAISSNWVPPSGAQLGCQAETGTGAAMGAAFACRLLGGSDIQIINAFCLALKNSMGLTCDPVAGRVNTPCIKRNGFKALDALNAAFMSRKDVESYIKADEILIAMRETGLDMQSKYRETSEGGLAKTSTGLKEKFLNRTNYCC